MLIWMFKIGQWNIKFELVNHPDSACKAQDFHNFCLSLLCPTLQSLSQWLKRSLCGFVNKSFCPEWSENSPNARFGLPFGLSKPGHSWSHSIHSKVLFIKAFLTGENLWLFENLNDLQRLNHQSVSSENPLCESGSARVFLFKGIKVAETQWNKAVTIMDEHTATGTFWQEKLCLWKFAKQPHFPEKALKGCSCFFFSNGSSHSLCSLLLSVSFPHLADSTSEQISKSADWQIAWVSVCFSHYPADVLQKAQSWVSGMTFWGASL